MSVLLVLITVLLMLPVSTAKEALPVPVAKDTVEMGSPVWVRFPSPHTNYRDIFCRSDIDECATGADNCSPNAACTNIPGSFTCTCNQEYSGNGVTCEGIPSLIL